MKRIYILSTLCALGSAGATPVLAQESAEPTGYHLHNLVFTYNGNYNGRVIGCLDGTEQISGKEYSLFRLQPAPTDQYLGPDNSPLRFDGKRVYEWLSNLPFWGVELTPQEVLLYDFDAKVGEKWGGLIISEIEHGLISVSNRTVAQARDANLFGTAKRVQRVVEPEELNEWLTSPYHNETNNYKYGSYGEAFVVIEDIGNMTLPGSYAYPVVYELPTMYTGPYETCSLEKVESADGKYTYTHVGLGVSPGNQIMRTGNVWEYYSETPQYEALHSMVFEGTAERDGKLYGRFYTKSAIIRDKATGLLSELVNDDPENRCVLMRENLGEVYVRGLNDADETLMYDFMLQPGDEFQVSGTGEAYSVVEMPVITKDFHPDSFSSYNEPLKTYSFAGYEDKMGVTEYTGLWGDNAGTLVNPMFAGGTFGGVQWPWAPAADCTLARQYELLRDNLDLIPNILYINPEAWEKAEALQNSVEVSAVGSDAEAARWYTLQGVPVSAPEHEHIYIRVSGSRAEKIAY